MKISKQIKELRRISYLQSDNESCGPISMINLNAIWGTPYRKGDLAYFRELTNCAGRGTTRSDVQPILEKHGYKVTKVKQKYRNFEQALKKGPLLCGYHHRHRASGHWVLLQRVSKTKVAVINTSQYDPDLSGHDIVVMDNIEAFHRYVSDEGRALDFFVKTGELRFWPSECLLARL